MFGLGGKLLNRGVTYIDSYLEVLTQKVAELISWKGLLAGNWNGRVHRQTEVDTEAKAATKARG
jgi:hypothetical protein